MHPKFTPEIIARFWSNVDRSGGPDACWEWQGSRHPFGYGQSYFTKPVTALAHRVAWIIEHGAITSNQFVCHRCDNPPCVNPTHLFLGTQLDNMRDMNAKGRHPHNPAWHPMGGKNPRAKLTDNQVVEARRRYGCGGVSKSQLAREYGVSSTMMAWIILQKHWTHLPSVDDLMQERQHRD